MCQDAGSIDPAPSVEASSPLDALTQAQARQWITKLTKETKGKAKPAPGDPVVVPPAKHRKKAPPVATAPPAPPEDSAPSEADFIQARTIILQQLAPMGMTAPQTIDQVLRHVGIEVAIRAVGLARQTIQAPRGSPSGEHRLTALEQWVICCRQLQNRMTW